MSNQLITVQNKFLANKKWWIEETDKEYVLHVIYKRKEFVSLPIHKYRIAMFKGQKDAEIDIVNLAVNNIEYQIKREENLDRLQKEVPYWKRGKYE